MSNNNPNGIKIGDLVSVVSYSMLGHSQAVSGKVVEFVDQSLFPFSISINGTVFSPFAPGEVSLSVPAVSSPEIGNNIDQPLRAAPYLITAEFLPYIDTLRKHPVKVVGGPYDQIVFASAKDLDLIFSNNPPPHVEV